MNHPQLDPPAANHIWQRVGVDLLAVAEKTILGL